MKKVISLILAVVIATSTSAVAFATGYNAEGEETFDLNTITQPVQVIFEDREVLPDGTVIVTTTTATSPKLTRAGTEETTVTTTKNFNLNGAPVRATVTLTTYFWYNKAEYLAGWSDATVDTWIAPEATNYNSLDYTTPEGTTGTPLFGDTWVKVNSKWTLDVITGSDSSVNVWNKITSSGKISKN